MRKALNTLRIKLLAVCVFSICTAGAQDLHRQCLAGSGGSNTLAHDGSTYLVQHSVGQGSITGITATQTTEARQGFIQPMGSATVISTDNGIDLFVFPNPFQDHIDLEVSESLDKSVTLTLSDLSGRTVQSWQFESLSKQRLDCVGLPVGSYLLRIQTDTQSSTIQIIKS